MKRVRRLILAAITAATLTVAAAPIASHAANPNNQNMQCQNGYYDPVLHHCINNH